MRRGTAITTICAAALSASAPRPARAAGVTPPTVAMRTLEVPFDYDRPQDGTFPLPVALLQAFDPAKPTVIVVSDGQQFFINETAFAPSIAPLFDERFNVAGVFGRGTVAALQQRTGSGAHVDWRESYRLLRARQWIGDLESARRALVGENGQVLLFGRSGGATMVHQYLAAYGDRVARVLVQASVDHALEVTFGLESDRFWDELTGDDRAALTAVLRRQPALRPTIVDVFQRQNFFVDRVRLDVERHRLIAALASGDRSLLDDLVVKYQVSAIRTLEASPIGPSIAVRLYELCAPWAGRYDLTDDTHLYPDHEAALRAIAPLLAAEKAGTIPLPSFDHRPLHGVQAQITMVAGRWDHTCDYRTQIALASCYPNARLFILDDDHTFHRMREAGAAPTVTIGALSAIDSPAYRRAQEALERLAWRETV